MDGEDFNGALLSNPGNKFPCGGCACQQIRASEGDVSWLRRGPPMVGRQGFAEDGPGLIQPPGVALLAHRAQ